MKRCAFITLLAFNLFSGLPSATAQNPTYDILILHGRVLDGTGNPWFQRDIGIRGNEIVAVGNLKQATARRVIDARGLYVTPGFIDLHSHADRGLVSDFLEARRAPNLAQQGITTVVSGSDGFNIRWPLAQEIAAYESKGIGVNAVLMVGHHSIITQVLGKDYERRPTAAEIEQMRALVRQGMDAGAWGLAAGLEYRPGRFATTEEVIELAQVVSDYGGFYIAHPRSESTMPIWQLPSQSRGFEVDGLQALEEMIRLGRATGIRVVGTHHKARGRTSHGRSLTDLQLINQARNEGVQVFLDVYPFETWGGVPYPAIPAWACLPAGVEISGGADSPEYEKKGLLDDWQANLKRNWGDPKKRKLIEGDIAWLVDRTGGADKTFVLDYPDRSCVGKTLAQLAAEKNKTVTEIVIEMSLNGDKNFYGGARLRGYGLNEEDVANYLKQDYTAIGSDNLIRGIKGVRGFEGQIGDSPRDVSAFIRPITHFVKTKQAITLPHAIRAQTSLPAAIIGLPDRGVIRTGYKADIVIFDLERLQDRATIYEPALPPEGIEYVLVNGQFTLDKGKLPGTLPGVVLKRAAK